MRGIRMSEGMNSGSLVDPTFFHSGTEGALYSAFIHGLVGCLQGRRKDPQRMAVAEPVLSQHLQTSGGQWNVAIFSTFSLIDVQQLAFSIDVLDLQAYPFQQ